MQGDMGVIEYERADGSRTSFGTKKGHQDTRAFCLLNPSPFSDDAALQNKRACLSLHAGQNESIPLASKKKHLDKRGSQGVLRTDRAIFMSLETQAAAC